MTQSNRRALVVWTFGLAFAIVAASAVAQDAPGAPPPPEVQRLIDLAKNPDRIREIMSDPDRLTELMKNMESPQVQEYFRDPQRVQELMQQIDIGQIRDVMRSVDMAKVRQAMASRWKQRLKEMLKATD